MKRGGQIPVHSASFQCLRLSHSGNNELNSNIFILEEKKKGNLISWCLHSHKCHCSE